MGNDSRVLLDLNYPEFQKAPFNLNVGDVGKIFATFKKLRAMIWPEVFKDRGLLWEEMKIASGKYTVHFPSPIAQLSDAMATICDSFPRTDHDGTYGKR